MSPVPAAVVAAPSPGATADLVRRLRALAIEGLPRMYRRDLGLFAFRVRRHTTGVVMEGLSHRYTAIVLLGLAGEAERDRILERIAPEALCARLLADLGQMASLGDVALTAWAATALDHPGRRAAWDRLRELQPADAAHPTVELSWALAAACAEETAPARALRGALARRLVGAFDPRSAMFPHVIGEPGRAPRAHVACFADLVYPVHALARYFAVSGEREALDVASRCARAICRLQGTAGQWWWHYDRRTGRVVEHYPVYAVHQDAMAPMALLALQDASGERFDAAIARGLAWLASAPELGGGSLIDTATGFVWRKVARREPGKASRYLQAAASRLHPHLRVPGLDIAAPPRAVDHEDRPYHLGWLLHAWSPERVARLEATA